MKRKEYGVVLTSVYKLSICNKIEVLVAEKLNIYHHYIDTTKAFNSVEIKKL